MRRWLAVLVLVALVVQVAHARPLLALTTSLSGYWTLNETSGVRADSLGTSNLSDNNTVGATTGVLGNAARFVAVNSEYLSHSDNATLSTGNVDFSFAYWVNFRSGSAQVVLHKGYTSAADNLEFYADYNTLSANKIRWIVGTQLSGGNYAYVESDAISNNTWVFVVMWHDAANNQIGISINNGTPNTASWAGGAVDTTHPFFIGVDGNFSTGFGDFDLDELGFWKKVLTAQERTDLYNAGVGCTYDFAGCDTGLFTPTPTATATSTPGPTATSTSTPVPSSTPTATPTLVPTPTATPTPFWWEVDTLPGGDQYLTERRATYGELWIIRLQIAEIVFLVFVALFVLRRWK